MPKSLKRALAPSPPRRTTKCRDLQGSAGDASNTDNQVKMIKAQEERVEQDEEEGEDEESEEDLEGERRSILNALFHFASFVYDPQNNVLPLETRLKEVVDQQPKSQQISVLKALLVGNVYQQCYKDVRTVPTAADCVRADSEKRSRLDCAGIRDDVLFPVLINGRTMQQHFYEDQSQSSQSQTLE